MQIFIFVIVLLFSSVSSENVKGKMEEHEIVPDIIDKAPLRKLSVIFNRNEVNLGNELTPTQVKDEPAVKWDSEPNCLYTLLMVDPDAPSRTNPTFKEVLHWSVGNIPGSDLKKGDEYAGFRGSGPPNGTGLHRYIFLLYKQQGKINFEEPKIPSKSREHRFKFSTRNFVTKYNLGDPIEGNFYQAQWDEYVDIRNKNEAQN